MDLGGPVCSMPERGCLLRGAGWTTVVLCLRNFSGLIKLRSRYIIMATIFSVC